MEDLIDHNIERLNTAEHILNALESHAEKSKMGSYAIAGGLVRDALLGKKIRDIDVFIEVGNVEEKEKENVIRKILGLLVIKLFRARRKLAEFKRTDLNGVYKDYDYEGAILKTYECSVYNINLIFLRVDVKYYVSLEFNCGISQAMLTNSGVYVSRLFLNDSEQQILRMFPNGCGRRPHINYINKLKKKYPEYTVAVDKTLRDKVNRYRMEMVKVDV